MSALISAFAYFKPAFSQSAAAPLPLFALLLFNAPDVFTLRALFAFVALGERIHQLRAAGLQRQAHKHYAPDIGALSAGFPVMPENDAYRLPSLRRHFWTSVSTSRVSPVQF